MDKERGKTYFLTKATQYLFLFCSLWKVLTALGTAKQFTTGTWKNLIALEMAFVFSSSSAWRSLKKTTCLVSPKCTTPSSVRGWLWAGMSATLTLTYDNFSRYSDKAVCKKILADAYSRISLLLFPDSPSGDTKISLSLFMLRFSEAIVVSCSGTVLCLCSSLPFVDQHGTTVHLFMIYFSQ